jgi:hypothetical protein
MVYFVGGKTFAYDPVKDASGTFTAPEAGTYRVLVRTKHWHAPHGIGTFQVLIDRKALEETFGTKGGGKEQGVRYPQMGTAIIHAYRWYRKRDYKLPVSVFPDTHVAMRSGMGYGVGRTPWATCAARTPA